MAEPSRRASRLSIAGAMLVLLGVGAVGFVLGRSTVEPVPITPATPTPGPSRTPAPALPAVQPPLGRAELIALVASAVDAFAAGRPLPESVTGLADRNFELRLPFGCPGAPELGGGSLRAEYDEAAEVLRVHAQPVRWVPEDWLPQPETTQGAVRAAESIEGFWISRPWTSAEVCPSAPPAPRGVEGAQPPTEQTLGIAQIFTTEASRVGRRDGKPYEAVESVTPGTLDLSQGLRLRLRGKLVRAPGGGLVLCRPSVGMRPVCLLSAKLDEVAIELPMAGTTMATWDVSSQTREQAER